MNNLMRRSGIIAVLSILLCLCLLVCSCGGNGGDETTEDPGTEETPDVTTGGDVTDESGEATDSSSAEETDPVDPPANVTYTVYVKDAEGNPIANVPVMLCNGDQCGEPVATDATGTATFTMAAATYQASVASAVEGYEVDTTKKYDFAADETSLTITLVKKAVVPPVEPEVDDDKVDLKEEAELLYVDTMDGVTAVYFEGIMAMEEAIEVGSTTYVYESTADGYLIIAIEAGANINVTVKNVTTGVDGLPLNGAGLTAVPVTDGNTYEVVVTANVAEAAMYAVVYMTEADGSEEMPHYLAPGMVEVAVKVPAGETVWFRYVDTYFAIEDVNAKVELNNTVFNPNANGVILGSDIGLGMGNTIGISSASAEDDVIIVKLSGSNKNYPLYFTGSYEAVTVPAGATVYVDACDMLVNTIIYGAGEYMTLYVDGVEVELPYVCNGNEVMLAVHNANATRQGLYFDMMTNDADNYTPVTDFATTEEDGKTVYSVGIAAGATAYVDLSSLMGKVVYEVNGDVTVNVFGNPLSFPVAFSGPGAYRMTQVEIVNAGETATTVEIVVCEIPAGVSNDNPVEITGEETATVDPLVLTLGWDEWMGGAQVVVRYTAAADGILNFSVPGCTVGTPYYVYSPDADGDGWEEWASAITDANGNVYLEKGQWVDLVVEVSSLEAEVVCTPTFTEIAEDDVVAFLEVEITLSEGADYADLAVAAAENHTVLLGASATDLWDGATVTVIVLYTGDDAEHACTADACLTVTVTEGTWA